MPSVGYHTVFERVNHVVKVMYGCHGVDEDAMTGISNRQARVVGNEE